MKYMNKTGYVKSRTKHILGPDKTPPKLSTREIKQIFKCYVAPYLKTTEILLRNGLDPSPKSFASCVSNAASEYIIESTLIDKSCLAKQEMYDYSIDEIKNIIQSPTEYLDGKYFISLFDRSILN